MTWTARRFAFVAIVAAIFFVLWGIAKLVLAVGLGLGTGGPMNLFTFPMLAVLAAHVRDEKAAMIFPVFVFSLLVLPLPALGEPGDFLKVPALVVPFVVAEPLFWLLEKRPRVASTAAGALAAFLIAFFIVNVLTNDVSPVVQLIAAVEGGVGGFLGYEVYMKIRDRSAIKWFRAAEGARL